MKNSIQRILIILVMMQLTFSVVSQSVGQKIQKVVGSTMIEFVITSVANHEVSVCAICDAKTVEIPGHIKLKSNIFTVTGIDGNGECVMLNSPNKGKVMSFSKILTDRYSKAKNPKISTLVLPPSIKSISANAFSDCGELSTVKLNDALSYVGDNAFAGTPALSSPEFAARLDAIQNGSSSSTGYMASTASGVESNSHGASLTASAAVSNPKAAGRLSDVDQNIPQSKRVNDNTFALIIANEEYQNGIEAVPFALNDGKAFEEYCIKTLGLPRENVKSYYNVGLNGFRRALRTIQNIGRHYDGDASFIVYYAGHGIPDEKSRDAYLLPVDGDGSDFQTGVSLSEFNKMLAEIPSKQTVLFMDACFTGSKRDGGMLAAARAVSLAVAPTEPTGKVVMISSAQGDQTAWSYNEKGHGLFTYYLLKSLQDSQGDITLGELAESVCRQVSRKSSVINEKEQVPSVMPSSTLGDSWKKWKLN